MNIPRVWGAEMKDSDPNHSKAIFRVYYPPHLLPKIFGCIAFKSLGTPSYLIKSHIIALYFESWVSSTWGRAEKKNSDPNPPKALFRVYYTDPISTIQNDG